MAVRTPDGIPVVGFKYTKVTDSDADWGSIPNDTYFYDLSFNLPYYKDADGNVNNAFIPVLKTINGNSITGTGNVDLSFDREQDYVNPYLYLGWAVTGASTASNVWSITRVEILTNGTVVEKFAGNVAWDNRYSVIYS